MDEQRHDDDLGQTDAEDMGGGTGITGGGEGGAPGEGVRQEGENPDPQDTPGGATRPGGAPPGASDAPRHDQGQAP